METIPQEISGRERSQSPEILDLLARLRKLNDLKLAQATAVDSWFSSEQ